ncbi:Rho guanine nucleotide exchange factor 8-like protein [Tanacetum coccineum]
MVNSRHKEVLKGSTSKEVGPSASDADHGDSGSSFSSKGLNFRGFTDEETKVLSSMKSRQVGKEIKNAMPYYISQTTDNFKEMTTYHDFTACDVSKFDGKLNPIANTRWLSAVKGAFRTSCCKEKHKVNFASNFLRDRAKMWWDEKEEFETLMQTNETVKELLKKFNELIPYCPGYHGNEKLKVREADLLRKKNKEGKETKRKLEFGDQDTKKPKHDHGRRGYDDETKRRPTDEHSCFKEARSDAHYESEKGVQRNDKWWLPTVKVPPERLSEESRKWMQYQKDCVNQVLKASMAINAEILAEVEIPENYIENLPKNGRESLGDAIYKNITVEFFDPGQFMSTMDLSSDINVLDLKNKIEASIVIWKSKMHQKDSKCLLEFVYLGEKRAL